ncbi:MAG TPA: CDP-glucose 4,6-dehydratase [Rhodospirillaceae bacterium]|nr:MAG: CDP-glucose 4,6-dehydratase [Alphaproteobacteria bacterium GWF2_58_20]HAU28746.1 CDP-glucose 4,6-dehydratase [Rhodospirillaceae bacterium]
MEGLVMNAFDNIYADKRVLVTGHNGFKGTWLTEWLVELGAKVSGIALPPNTKPNHWELRTPHIDEHIQDVREEARIAAIIQETQPEIVFHLAAQPLVRKSYREPLLTFSTNVMGTANVLDACRQTPSVKAIVVITTDKCYENQEWVWGYRENDRLGGHDPYSASKATAELVVGCWRKSFFSTNDTPLLASARAGNVIGGGDWAEDRLIPDLVRAVKLGEPLVIRSPRATRPWQHVLEPLAGYLMLGQKLLEGRREFAEAWNFGPDDASNQTVETVLNHIQSIWPVMTWQLDANPQMHEANLLHLDSSKARRLLHWTPVWDLEDCLEATVGWYRDHLSGKPVPTKFQIEAYCETARQQGAEWIRP